MTPRVSLRGIINVETEWRICCLFKFSIENNFLSLLATIKIESHFPMEERRYDMRESPKEQRRYDMRESQ